MAICTVKRAIASDLDTWYQNHDVCMLMNKSTLLDPRLKDLAHLTEEEQETTVNGLVDEIVTSCLQSTPISATVSHNYVTESTEFNNDHSPPTKKKKCALEKLFGDTISSANPDSSLSVSLNELC